MTTSPEQIKVKVSDDESVSGLLYLADKKNRAGVTVILGHGAGANQLHPFMRLFAVGLAERGLDALTFNFQYMEQGRHVPDPKAKLESCYTSVIEAARKHKKLKGNQIVIGGKSMGGRIASQVAAGDDPPETAALVFLGYPLHPPGRPDKLRDAHLPQIKSPMLFIQGSRDAFGTADELRPTIKKHHLKATLNIVEGGDHSLKVPKSSGQTQTDVYSLILQTIVSWVRDAGV